MRRGRIPGVELKAVYTNGDLRAYANWAWAIQRATNIVTNQYLFGADEIAYIQNNWINTDHSQVWTGSGGISYLWNGTRFTTDVIYGSGFRAGDFNTDHVAPYASVNAGMSHEFYIPGWNPITCAFRRGECHRHQLRHQKRRRDRRVRSRNTARAAATISAWRRSSGRARTSRRAAPPAYVPVYLPGYAPSLISKDAMAAVWTWTGFYMGGNVGRSTGKLNTDTLYSDNLGNPLFATSTSFKHFGGVGGAQIGYNWQAGMVVAGLESDVVFGSSAHDRCAFACPGAICNPAITLIGLRCAGGRGPSAQSGLVRDGARAPRRGGYAGHAALWHRRACVRRGRASAAPFTAPASTSMQWQPSVPAG